MTPAERQALRNEIERQTADFIARGGKIQEIPAGVMVSSPVNPLRTGGQGVFRDKVRAAS